MSSGSIRSPRRSTSWPARARSRLHTSKVLRLSSDLPIVIEIVDTEEKIEGFLPLIDNAIPEGLATIEKVEVHFYRSGDVTTGE